MIITHIFLWLIKKAIPAISISVSFNEDSAPYMDIIRALRDIFC